jgi:hypothetical protein
MEAAKLQPALDFVFPPDPLEEARYMVFFVFKSPVSLRIFPVQLALALSTAALVVACGGGGGGSGSNGANPPASITGNGFAPDTGPGDVDNYFPNAVGTQWSYAYIVTHPYLVPTQNTVTTTIVAPQTIHGVQATVLRQVDPVGDMSGLGTYDSYFSKSGGGLTALGTSLVDDTINAAIVPYVQLRFPVELGSVSMLTAISMPAGQDGSGHPLTLDMVQQIENTDFATVDVPAGSFRGALVQVTTVAGKVRNEALGLSSSFIGTATQWIASGVGIVKQTSSLTVNGSTTTTSQELTGYELADVKHGVGNTMTVLGGLSPSGSVSPATAGQPAVASDGGHFLVVARKFVETVSTHANWVASLVDADGASLGAEVDLGPAAATNGGAVGMNAAVVFDGIEYLVVYEQAVDSGLGSQSISLVATRVSTRGLLIGSPTIVAAPGATMPTLSFDGTRCLLGMVRRSSTGASRITGVFVSPSTGAADGREFDISPPLVDASAPALAFDRLDHVIVWDQPQWSMQTRQGVFAARIDTAGDLLDPAAIAVHMETLCCSDIDHQPAIASDGNGCMVVWQDYRQLTTSSDNVYANRISLDGQLLDGNATTGGIALTTSVGRSETSPTIAFFDGEYLAAWSASSSSGTHDGLFAARISPQGSVLTPFQDGVQLVTNELRSAPRLAVGRGSCMLTWLDHMTVLGTVRAVSIHPFAR